jgi:flagellar biosynthesis chaperone FliJ
LRAKVFNLHDLYDLEVLRVVSLEERVARIEGFLEQMDKRLNHLESEVRELRRDLNNRFFWLLGVQISMWVTIILAVLIK